MVVWCVCVCMLCVSLYVQLSWCPSLQIHCPELMLYFECWSPHPQTVDTELLSQRLNISTVCLNVCMAMQLLPYLNYEFAVNIQINNTFTENRN